VRNTFVPHRDEQGALVSFDGLIQDITERKQAEAAMRESESKFRSFVENAPDGIFLTDRDQNYQLVNPAACAMTGYTAEEFAHMNIRDLVPVEGMVEAKAIHDRLVEDGRVSLEVRLKRKDGSIFWAALDAVKIDEDHLLAFCKDITERKQMEEALRASNEKFTKIYNMSPDAIDLTHLETGVQLEANQSYLRMTGYTHEELIGHSTLPGDLGIWLHREDRDRLIASIIEHGEERQFETLLRRKNGDVFNALISSSLLEIGGERYNLSICRDITERNNAEKLLRKNEAHYRHLFNNAEVGMYQTRIDGSEVIEVNNKYLEILGMRLDEVQHKPSTNLWADPRKREEMVNRLKADGFVTDLEVDILDARRELHHCITSAKLFKEEGIIEGSIQDITKRKMAEAESVRLETKVQEAHKLESLGVLSAGVAHNLNNILTIIMGNASLREQAAADPLDRKAYLGITKACARGRDVVKSMLHFAQPNLSVKKPIELHTMIKEVRVLLENTTRNAINISEVFVGEPLWMNGDPSSINHAILNLCLNSLGAMPNGGSLSFRTSILEKNLVEVSVEDTGTGMTPEILAHVMEPFYTTKEVGNGIGLGLSMTYGVVKAHGGSIDIATQVGQGTSVRLRFPRIPAPVQVGSVTLPAPSLESMKVFLVDDDEDVRFLMTRMLKQAGVRQVRTFSGGEEVIDYLRSGELPDLIILDQNMPGMKGTQTMEQIRGLHPEMPVLISSGQPDIEAWDDFKQPRVAVISKPFTFEEIQAKLAQFAQDF